MVLWIDAAVTTVAVASLKVPGRAGDHSDWQLGMQDVASARRRSDQTNSASSKDNYLLTVETLCVTYLLFARANARFKSIIMLTCGKGV